MKRQMTIEQRLREYAEWLREPGLEVAHGWSIFGRIQEEKQNAGARGGEILPDIIDGVSCRPDGGMARMVERMGRELQRDRRCRDIHDLVQYLPEHHRKVLAATYGAVEPRSLRAAAALLGVSVVAYRESKAALFAWFEGAMFRVGALV